MYAVAATPLLPVLCPCGPAARFGKLACDSAIKRRVHGLLLLLERQGRKLEGVQNITKIQLGNARYGFVVVSCFPARRSLLPLARQRGGGTGVTSPVPKRVSPVTTFTTIAVMLSMPPLLLASAIIALTIRSGFARERRSC